VTFAIGNCLEASEDRAALGRPLSFCWHEQAIIEKMERRPLDAVDPQPGNVAMQRIKHPPIRNKINLAEPAQLRAWTRRLRVSADALKSVVGKVGNSVAAVTREIELQRPSRQPCPTAAIASKLAESELPASP
jgi:Protein of unknown function (DUF3606)